MILYLSVLWYGCHMNNDTTRVLTGLLILMLSKKYLFSYQFVIFKFFWINSIFIIKVSISLHDSNAFGSCTVQITASMETHITKSLFINNITKFYKYTKYEYSMATAKLKFLPQQHSLCIFCIYYF